MPTSKMFCQNLQMYERCDGCRRERRTIADECGCMIHLMVVATRAAETEAAADMDQVRRAYRHVTKSFRIDEDISDDWLSSRPAIRDICDLLQPISDRLGTPFVVAAAQSTIDIEKRMTQHDQQQHQQQPAANKDAPSSADSCTSTTDRARPSTSSTSQMSAAARGASTLNRQDREVDHQDRMSMLASSASSASPAAAASSVTEHSPADSRAASAANRGFVNEWSRDAGQLKTPAKKRKTSVPWTFVEERNLRRGVREFGAGEWAAIRRKYFTMEPLRTGVDLKDKWRSLNGQRTPTQHVK